MKKMLSLFCLFISLMLVFTSCEHKVITEFETAGSDTSAVTSAESTQNETSDTDKTTFLAAGDNLMHESVYLDAEARAAAKGETGYDFTDMYGASVTELVSNADIAYVNQEGPMDPNSDPSGYPAFNAPSADGDTLVDMGFNVINLANNHMLDKGETGLQGTIDYWKTKNVTSIGGYEGEADSENIRIVEQDGVRIAFLSFTYGTNGNSVTSDSLFIPYINEATITSQISQAKTESDLVFVSMHWGEENSFEPTDDQKSLAQSMADAGADAIIGMHSHTLQPVEWLDGSSGNRTLVAYSLGNFISSQLYSYNLVEGLLTFDISKDGSSYTIENVLIIPIVCHYNADTSQTDSLGYYKRYNIQLYKLSDYTEELCSENGSQNWGQFSLSTLKNYVTSAVSSEFLENDD